MQSSLERINPANIGEDEIGGHQTLQLHLERYEYAGRNLVSGTIGDIACGTGYGSYLLAEKYGSNINKILAVDNHFAAIEYAKSQNAHPLIEFINADAMEFQAPAGLSSIVSLETIEHLPDPVAFVQKMARSLLPGGRFIASVPITPSMDANPYHLHDFTGSSFRKLFLTNGFREIDSYIQLQHYHLPALIRKKNTRAEGLRKNVFSFYIKNPSKFLLRLRSLLRDGFTNKYMVGVFEKI